ncbi:MAG: hypothetical protein QXY16_02500 [Nanopusillaceae archaeon]
METIVELTLKEYVYLEWIKQNDGRLIIISTKSKLNVLKEIAKALLDKGLIHYSDIIIKEIERSNRYFLIEVEFKDIKFTNYKIIDTFVNKVRLKIDSKHM